MMPITLKPVHAVVTLAAFAAFFSQANLSRAQDPAQLNLAPASKPAVAPEPPADPTTALLNSKSAPPPAGGANGLIRLKGECRSPNGTRYTKDDPGYEQCFRQNELHFPYKNQPQNPQSMPAGAGVLIQQHR